MGLGMSAAWTTEGDQIIAEERDRIKKLCFCYREAIALGSNPLEATGVIGLGLMVGGIAAHTAATLSTAVARIAELEDELAKLRGEH